MAENQKKRPSVRAENGRKPRVPKDGRAIGGKAASLEKIRSGGETRQVSEGQDNAYGPENLTNRRMPMNQAQPRSARLAALLVLNRIEKDGAYPNIALKEEAAAAAMTPQDRGLCQELALGVLRRKRYLDHALAQYSKIKLKKIALPILNILRLSIYQLLFLSEIPQSAAVNEAVKLARKFGHEGSARFVNGVLRGMIRGGCAVTLPDPEAELASYLSLKESVPRFLIEKFLTDFGKSFTIEFLEAVNRPQRVQIRTNLSRISRGALKEALAAYGIESEEIPFLPEGLTLLSGADFSRMDAFQKGLFTVQGAASQLASRVLAPQPGDRVLDLCAAPGGKTTHIAQLMGGTGQITACDLHPHKKELILKNAARLGFDQIDVQTRDAAQFYEPFSRKFDKILCDAPCSGLGVLAKKPDIRYNITSEDFETLTALQSRILDCAAQYLKPGGVLVYATCTVNPDENGRQIDAFLARHPEFLPDGYLPQGAQMLAGDLDGGRLLLLPQTHKTDGFFIARLKKQG